MKWNKIPFTIFIRYHNNRFGYGMLNALGEALGKENLHNMHQK
ncbi:hypothetical protein [Dysgonomonas termitidis]|uniref:Uncharacterized protein n=1 Tax=Dysgonomonas termitidis TaxID=1516126 RepID=A0ABV9L0A2_9BACT